MISFISMKIVMKREEGHRELLYIQITNIITGIVRPSIFTFAVHNCTRLNFISCCQFLSFDHLQPTAARNLPSAVHTINTYGSFFGFICSFLLVFR